MPPGTLPAGAPAGGAAARLRRPAPAGLGGRSAAAAHKTLDVIMKNEIEALIPKLSEEKTEAKRRGSSPLQSDYFPFTVKYPARIKVIKFRKE